MSETYETPAEMFAALDAETGLRHHPVTGEALDIMPGTTEDDFLPMYDDEGWETRAALAAQYGATLPRTARPTPAVKDRADLFLETLEAHHWTGRHPNGGHVFCPTCRPHWARLSLYRRLTLDWRFDPTLLDPMAKGWKFADGTTDAEGAERLFHTLEELRDLQAPEMLIDRVLPASSYGILSGRDGTWKTFLALDLGCTLAAGLEQWRGEDVGPWDPSRVLFLAGEGAGQLPSRVDTWCAHNDVDQERLESLTFMSSVPNLFTGGPAYDAVLDWATENQPALIVVDTLRRASGAADQNSARDMGLVTDRLHQLKEASGGTVLVIAHTDKGDNDARGSSSIEDDADFVLHVKRRTEPLRQELAVTKMKDAADDFRLTTYPTPLGESIVMGSETTEIRAAWSSSSNRSRVIAALRAAPAGEHLGCSEVSLLTGDTGDTIDRATVYREVVRLQKEGGVEKHGAKYRLTDGWEEPMPETKGDL